MPTLDELRNTIDQLDKAIMNALNKRFSLMNDVKLEKQRLKLEITQNNREKVVLDKADAFEYGPAIKKIYQEIILVSKSFQND